MDFSPRMTRQAQERFQLRLAYGGSHIKETFLPLLAQAEEADGPQVRLALEWLYGASPFSDLVNYPFSLFLSCARHGVFLRSRSPFAHDLPEDIFLLYVLHSRVNEEELSDCRPLFYRSLAPRLEGLSASQAVLEVNRWAAERVTYRSTDDRTRSALGTLSAGAGRCGEESVFLVNALRAAGLPARQVYAPRWAHCDDNHAWVEVWIAGRWHFLGACEPEEALDRGWFIPAAGRAPLVHSRCFSPPSEGEELIACRGALSYLNQSSRYTETVSLTVAVRDAGGLPVEGAEVSFQVLNYAAFHPIARAVTGPEGEVRLSCGRGSLLLHVQKDGVFCEKLVHLQDLSSPAVSLTLTPAELSSEGWEDFVCSPPAPCPPSRPKPVQEEKVSPQAGTTASKERWNARSARRLLRTQELAQVLEAGPALQALLAKSGDNAQALAAFLTQAPYPRRDKEALLATLSEKDLSDVDPQVLEEVLALAPPKGELPDALFYPYVLCPRVEWEPLTSCRAVLLNALSPAEKAAFRADPAALWTALGSRLSYDPRLEYDRLVALPAGALTAGKADLRGRRLLFVALCRALGVPARLDPVYRQAECYAGGRFRPVEGPERDCSIRLTRTPDQAGLPVSLSLLEDGAFRPLDLSSLTWGEEGLCFSALPGFYRVVSADRLPSGELFASQYLFHLEPGRSKVLPLRRHQAPLSRMLGSFPLEEFFVRDRRDRPVKGSRLTRRPAVLIWLEAGTEPTEHLLNELLERRADFAALPAEPVLLVRGEASLEHPKLRQVLKALPSLRVCFHDFGPSLEALARQLYVEPGKLPLLLLADGPLHGVYASAGYNVGSGEMLLKLCPILSTEK